MTTDTINGWLRLRRQRFAHFFEAGHSACRSWIVGAEAVEPAGMAPHCKNCQAVLRERRQAKYARGRAAAEGTAT
jgi:hypothetical protein